MAGRSGRRAADSGHEPDDLGKLARLQGLEPRTF